MGNGLYILFSKRVHGKNGESSAQIQKYINSRHIRQGMPAFAFSATKACISHCVPVTFLRSRGKFMSGDTFQGGAFFSSEGRFFFFRGALFFLQRGSFWSVEYAEKKSGGHRPP